MAVNDNIELLVRDKAKRINNIIYGYLPDIAGPQKTIMDAMAYSFKAGGKRLRPMLMDETYRMFGGSSEVIEPFMAAIEMIHTYSLIHDDLPALDNDDYRRGRKTSHKVYGEAVAILAGDALLNYAYETACRAFAMDSDAERVSEAIGILSRKAGIYGMVGGQTVDVEKTGCGLTASELEYIYENKTGAMIESAMMIGAVLADADDAQVLQIERIASNVGMAFQIQDDILDVTGNETVLGKPTLSDQENGKTTYVTLYGTEKSAERVKELSESAVKELEATGGDIGFLRDLIIWLIHRDR